MLELCELSFASSCLFWRMEECQVRVALWVIGCASRRSFRNAMLHCQKLEGSCWFCVCQWPCASFFFVQSYDCNRMTAVTCLEWDALLCEQGEWRKEGITSRTARGVVWQSKSKSLSKSLMVFLCNTVDFEALKTSVPLVLGHDAVFHGHGTSSFTCTHFFNFTYEIRSLF